VRATVADRRGEWPSLRMGLLAAAVLAALVVAVGSTDALLEDELPPRIDRVAGCFRREKLLEVAPATNDPIALEAQQGALATRVEGNGLHVAIAGSEAEAAELVSLYHMVAGNLTGRLEQRARYVYLWEGVATPTQRQTAFDCTAGY
jgi:hypothetical protein